MAKSCGATQPGADRFSYPCIDRVVGIPAQRPAACTLGGRDFKTLYVTTATRPLAESAKPKQPLAGSLFAIEVDVPGLPEACFAD